MLARSKTRLARLAAASRVADIYSGPDMEIASKQLRTLDQVTDYITVIRYDEFSDENRKIVLAARDLLAGSLRREPGLPRRRWPRTNGKT